MGKYEIIGYALVLICFLLYRYYLAKRQLKKQVEQRVKEEWGALPKREYNYEEYERISHYFYQTVKEEGLDDITWNDLDMDEIFQLLNSTKSSVGEEYLYKMLRTPQTDIASLKERNCLADFFGQHEEIAMELEKIYIALGRTRRISMYDYLSGLMELERKPNKHWWCTVGFFFSLFMLFQIPVIGMLLLIVSIGANITTYYREKAEVSGYFICMEYIIRMLTQAENIVKLSVTKLQPYNNRLQQIQKEMQGLQRNSFLLAGNGLSGSLADILLDYIRMIFHVDLIKFNSMLRLVQGKYSQVSELYEILGKLESCIAIASYRKLFSCCRPEFHEDWKQMKLTETYHPLIQEPVANTIETDGSVLLTGSNASGKSTFLKTVAVNAILAQTIYTCCAKSYQAGFYRIYSAMALQDNLLTQESYYMVEIKAIKRMMDKAKEPVPVLCFVDEVLRGTNTVERIAAGARILKSLAESAVCFAATHDIELTHMLEKYYQNYHFSEEIRDNQIFFSYRLHKGRAVSRNAIFLLRMMGYDDEVTGQAEQSADTFVKEGIWQPL